VSRRASRRGARERSILWRWSAIAACGLAAVLVTVALVAPAWLADRAVDRASDGRIRLAETDGTLWHGSGRLVFRDTNAPAGAGPLQGLVMPGRVRWDTQALPFVLGLVQAEVQLEGMSQPLRVTGTFGELRLGAGRLDLPPVELARLGSPWNTIRPVAGLGLQWEPLAIRDGALQGKASIELRDVTSAITPVRPLGSYRVDAASSGRGAELTIRTLSGPLKLEGRGGWDSARGLRFDAQAWAEGPEQPRLQPVLALIGRIEKDRTVIRIGE
jgi:general secretion pathway protein N